MAVVGAGYVGLVTGASLALIGHRVTCVDRDGGRVAGLREGRLPFYEPGLEELVARGVGAGRLSFTERLDEAVGLADVAFIAVGTPQGDDGGADLSTSRRWPSLNTCSKPPGEMISSIRHGPSPAFQNVCH